MKTVRIFLLICGILGSLVWIGTDIAASLSYEGYKYPLDPISGLTAVGAPTRSFVAPLVNVYVVLKIAFAFGVWMYAGQKRALRITAGLLLAWGLADLAAYFFPWNPEEPLGSFANVMHSIFAGGAAVFLILLAIGFGGSADGRWFRFYSYGTLLLMIVSGGIMVLINPPQVEALQHPAWFGLTERINAYGYMIWMLVLSIVLLRKQPEIVRAVDRARIVQPEAAAHRG